MPAPTCISCAKGETEAKAEAPNPPEPWESAWDGAFQGLLDDIKKDLSLLSEENKPRDDVSMDVGYKDDDSEEGSGEGHVIWLTAPSSDAQAGWEYVEPILADPKKIAARMALVEAKYARWARLDAGSNGKNDTSVKFRPSGCDSNDRIGCQKLKRLSGTNHSPLHHMEFQSCTKRKRPDSDDETVPPNTRQRVQKDLPVGVPEGPPIANPVHNRGFPSGTKRTREDRDDETDRPPNTRRRVQKDRKADGGRDRDHDEEIRGDEGAAGSGTLMESSAGGNAASTGGGEGRFTSYMRRRHMQHLERQAAVAEMIQERSRFVHNPAEQVESSADARDITDAEDKALKLQTMRSTAAGVPLTSLLQIWLTRYIPSPPIAKPPGYVAGAAVRERVAARAAERRHRGVSPKPSSTRPPGYIAGAAVRERVARKAAARKARQEKVAMLDRTRNSRTRRRGEVFFDGRPFVTAQLKGKEGQVEGKEGKENSASLESRNAREERMSTLMKLREAGKAGRVVLYI
ncbi:hypothetical protein B0H12DRAFT_1076499 [Mycena haematopus]|nr:hypothetical protein B0H12DRAFT_1076499 [Mycena haematopus]